MIGRDEAELVGATRLEGTSLADYADRHGLTRWAAYQRRGLAEARLGAALGATGNTSWSANQWGSP